MPCPHLSPAQYKDLQHLNYYSVSSKSFGVDNSGKIEEDISDHLIDPFNHKSSEDLLYNEEEFETARLHGEEGPSDMMIIRDYEGRFKHLMSRHEGSW